MKAQGTIEYLVILAVVVIAALILVAILFGFFNSGSGISEAGMNLQALSAPVAITETAMHPDGNVFLKIQNNTGDPITVTGVKIGDEDFPADLALAITFSDGITYETSETCENKTNVFKEVIITYETSNTLLKKQTYDSPIIFPCSYFSGEPATPPITDPSIPTTQKHTYLSTPEDFGEGNFFYTKLGSITQDGNSGKIPTGLVALWHFDETSGPTFTDSSENGNNGTCSNCPTSTDGLWNTPAQEFDGGSSINVPNNSSLDITTEITLKAWVKTESSYYRSCREILDQGGSIGDGLYWVDPDGTGGETPFQVQCDMTTNEGGWIQLKPTNSPHGTGLYMCSYSTTNHATKCGISTWPINPNTAYGTIFPGTYDYLCQRFHDWVYESGTGNTLTSDQIYALSQLNFTEKNFNIKSSSCDDDSGVYPSGHWNGYKDYTSDTFHANDCTTGNDSICDSTIGDIFETYPLPVTVCCSINSGGGVYTGFDQETLLVREPSTQTPTGINKPGAYGLMFNGSFLAGRINSQTISSTLNAGWNHVVMTYNSTLASNQLKLYINGQLSTQSNLTESITTTSNSLTIGQNHQGIIEEPAIWNRALTDEEILMDYNAYMDSNYISKVIDTGLTVTTYGSTTFNLSGLNYWSELDPGIEQPVSNNLISVWHFNGTLDDSIGTNNCSCNDCPTQTLNGLWETGAYSFSPSNDVSCGNGSSLDATNAITVSTWVNNTGANSIGTNSNPGESCLNILNNGGSNGDGLYWIDPDGTGGEVPFQVYCDMTTNGGGWIQLKPTNGPHGTGLYMCSYSTTNHATKCGYSNWPVSRNTDYGQIYPGAYTQACQNYHTWGYESGTGNTLTSDQIYAITQLNLIEKNFSILSTSCDDDSGVYPAGHWVAYKAHTTNTYHQNDCTSGNNDTCIVEAGNTFETYPFPLTTCCSINTGGGVYTGFDQETLLVRESTSPINPSGMIKDGAYSLTSNNSFAAATINSTSIQSELPLGWNHVVMTYDNTQLKLYINGLLSNQTNLTETITTNSNPLNIGKDQQATIEETALWSRALSENEVKELFGKGATKVGIIYRSCSQPNCSDGVWSITEYTSGNPISLTLPNNQYFQFATLFQHEKINSSPFIQSYSLFKDINISYTN